MPGHRPWLAVATGVLMWVSPSRLSLPGWLLALAALAAAALLETFVLCFSFEEGKKDRPNDPVLGISARCGLACIAHALLPCQHVAATGEHLPQSMHGTVNDIECSDCPIERATGRLPRGFLGQLSQLLPTSSPLHRHMSQHTFDKHPCWMHSFLHSIQSSACDVYKPVADSPDSPGFPVSRGCLSL